MQFLKQMQKSVNKSVCFGMVSKGLTNIAIRLVTMPNCNILTELKSTFYKVFLRYCYLTFFKELFVSLFSHFICFTEANICSNLIKNLPFSFGI